MSTKTLQTDLKEHPVYIAINSKNLRPKSRKAYVDCLIGFIAQDQGKPRSELTEDAIYHYPWKTLNANHVESVLSEMNIKPATYSKYLTAIRRIIKVELRDTDLVAKDFNYKDYMRLDQILKLEAPRNPRKKSIRRLLTLGEIEALARVCAEDESPTGARDNAMIDFMYTVGPRVSEISKLKIGNYDPSIETLEIKDAKGGKDRQLPTTDYKETLDEWIWTRGDEPGPLFCRVNKGGAVEIAPLTQQAISALLHRRADEAEVKRFSPHDLRATCATNLITRGVPVSYVSLLLGHSSIAITSRYDLTTEKEAFKSVRGVLYYPNMRKSKRSGGNGH